jgi:hypothetical protein
MLIKYSSLEKNSSKIKKLSWHQSNRSHHMMGKMDNEDELESLQDNLEEQIFNDLNSAENEQSYLEKVSESLVKL